MIYLDIHLQKQSEELLLALYYYRSLEEKKLSDRDLLGLEIDTTRTSRILFYFYFLLENIIAEP